MPLPSFPYAYNSPQRLSFHRIGAARLNRARSQQTSRWHFENIGEHSLFIDQAADGRRSHDAPLAFRVDVVMRKTVSSQTPMIKQGSRAR
jgi:hypothetical protein